MLCVCVSVVLRQKLKEVIETNDQRDTTLPTFWTYDCAIQGNTFLLCLPLTAIQSLKTSHISILAIPWQVLETGNCSSALGTIWCRSRPVPSIFTTPELVLVQRNTKRQE